MSEIYDITIRVRVFADDEQSAKKRAIYEAGAMAEEFSVPMGTTLGRSIEVSEFSGDVDELPVLEHPFFGIEDGSV